MVVGLRRLAPLAAALMLIAVSPAAAATVKGSSGALKATLTASTHKPKVNEKVPITVTATLSGKPVHATAVYQFVYAGSVVSTQYPNYNKHFSFTGHFADTLVFPPASVGQPLTLRVVVKASGRAVNLNWPITSHK